MPDKSVQTKGQSIRDKEEPEYLYVRAAGVCAESSGKIGLNSG